MLLNLNKERIATEVAPTGAVRAYSQSRGFR